MNGRVTKGSHCLALGLTGALVALAALSPTAGAQTWTHLVRNPPAAVNLMLLLPDGTVMCSRNDGTGTISGAWFRLTPDSTGSYINGTWTTLATAHDTRLYYSSQVLRDGRVFVAGGEYGTGGARAEVYDPQTNIWTQLSIPLTVLDPNAVSPVTGGNQIIYDANSEMLPDGSVMVMPVGPRTAGVPIIWNPATNVWSSGPRLFRGGYQDEASWVKLPDNTILTIDPFGTNSERYSPSLNAWINDGVVPVSLYDPFGSELGAAFLLADGRAFYLGSTGHTALYTPTGTATPGAWAAGPDIPGAHGTPDAPAAMMINGRILCAVSPVPTSANHFPPPTTFYEYDPVANSFTSVAAPVGTNDNIPCYKAAMLDLPNGEVLYSHMGVDVYAYHPVGAPLLAGKPAVHNLVMNADGSYHLTGVRFNGISEGASYGDDFQMNSNYPLVRVTGSDGIVRYARTYNWSSTGVATGNQEVSVEYRLPAGLPAGTATGVVVANGIASDPFDPVNGGPVVILAGSDINAFTDTTGNGNGNGRIEPGESDIRVSVGIRNSGNTPATGVTATLVSGVSTVTVTGATSAYPNLPSDGVSRNNTTPFVLSVGSNHPCGASIPLTLNVTSPQASVSYNFSFPTGLGGSPGPFTASYTGPVVPIPDNNAGTADAGLTVSGYFGTISDLNFRIGGSSCSSAQGSTTVGLDHSWVGDLTLTLVSPAGTTVTLMSHPGGAGNNGNNFCQTVLDDAAATSINTAPVGNAPWTGSFIPNSPLAAFNGQNPNGVWHLRAVDSVLGDTGSIRAFSLIFSVVATPTCDPPHQTCGSADFNCDGDIGTDSDIEAFFACLGGNCCAACDTADFNGDGDIGTDTDIEAFFSVLGGGHC